MQNIQQHVLAYAVSFAAGFAAGHIPLMAHWGFSLLMKVPGMPAFVRSHAAEINEDVKEAAQQIQSDVNAEAAAPASAPEPPK